MHTGRFKKLLWIGVLASWLLVPVTTWAAETLEYTIRWNTDDSRYQVFMRPTTTPTPDASMTAQATIRVPHASGIERFQVSGLTSAVLQTIWVDDSRTNAPTEDPAVDYISFTLNASKAPAFNWQANQEIKVFSFANTGSCLGPVEFVTDNDPLVTPVTAGGQNSAGTNPGNQFSNLGWADYAGENNYLGNYGAPALCSDSEDSDNDGIINGDEKAIGSDPNSVDSDNDGVSDAQEIGVDPTNPTDSDGDGIPDIIDMDDDNDGLLTVYENYNGGTPLDDDTDSDNTPDYLDSDDDNDGFPTISESSDPDNNNDPVDAADIDMDGLPDYLDTTDDRSDTDNDGIKDVDDMDDDGDGIPDSVEGDGVINSDADGVTDSLDLDSDNDGIPDSLEGHDANSDGVADTVPFLTDSNNNGLDDAFDPAANGIAAPLQDTDNNGIPDFRDDDDDGDAKLTAAEDMNDDGDNNPATEPLDADGDGLPDYLDTDESDGPDGDPDNDGLTNVEESTLGTDPEDNDTDGDGLSDIDELNGPDGNPATTSDNSNPLDADSDDDGLSDGVELTGADGDPATTIDNTDPNRPDSDGDGLMDGTELGRVTPVIGGSSDGSVPVVFTGTDSMIFVADSDPASTTNPKALDSDGGGDCDGSNVISGVCDAGEDLNNNGAVDVGERDPLVTSDDLAQGIQLQLRAMLQGPYNPTQRLMNDDLRAKGFLPVGQPYNLLPTLYEGDEQLSLALAQLEGDDAMVDWVLLELRDANDPSVIVAAKAMLLQRDGDIADSESGDTVWRPAGVAAGNYYVAIRHRNHLDLMTDFAVTLSGKPSLIDFSLVATAVKGNYIRFETDGLALMYAGDMNFDQRCIANGPEQDSTLLISNVLLYADNQDFNANYVMPGYENGDLNMDGNTIFTGPDNDMNLLMSNVLLHNDNDTFSANFIVNGSMNEAD